MFELKHHISDDNEDIHDYIISLDSDYGWNTAVKWADEMAESDIFSVTNLYTSASIGAPKKIMLAEYKANDKSIKSMESLKEEQGVIALKGISRELKAPVMIFWFNQTNIVEIRTFVGDEELMNHYTERFVNHEFWSKDFVKYKIGEAKRANAHANKILLFILIVVIVFRIVMIPIETRRANKHAVEELENQEVISEAIDDYVNNQQEEIQNPINQLLEDSGYEITPEGNLVTPDGEVMAPKN